MTVHHIIDCIIPIAGSSLSDTTPLSRHDPYASTSIESAYFVSVPSGGR